MKRHLGIRLGRTGVPLGSAVLAAALVAGSAGAGGGGPFGARRRLGQSGGTDGKCLGR